MPELHIEFEWQRDLKGYRIAPAEPPDRAKAVGVPTIMGADHGQPERIVRLGGKFIFYRPLVKFEGLYRQFAQVTSSEELLDFIGKFGPLTTPGLDPAIGEPVEHTLKYAALMKRLASSYSTGRQAQMAQALKDPMVPRLPNLQASLVVDPQTRNPKIQLTVRDLLSALWLQLGQKIAGGACVRSCQKCGTLFEVGPGTGRRLDAKFCSDEHRIAYHSLNRR